MKNKVKGMTLIEVIISMAILLIVISVIYLFYFSSNRILSDADIKEQLQTESHIVEDRITKIAMESSKILEIYDLSNNNLEGNKDGDVKSIKFERKIVDSLGVISIKEEIFKYDKTNRSIYYGNSTATDIMTSDSYTGLILLSDNVDEFKVKSSDVDYNLIDTTGKATTVKKFSDTKSIKIDLKLSIKRGYSSGKREISTEIKFRN